MHKQSARMIARGRRAPMHMCLARPQARHAGVSSINCHSDGSDIAARTDDYTVKYVIDSQCNYYIDSSKVLLPFHMP